MGPGDLQELMKIFQSEFHPDVIIGLQSGDDAGVVRIDEKVIIAQTIVDDPYLYGAIAATNSLSDIYAMGAQPLTAMNIACFPVKKLSTKVLKDILKGGYDKIKEAGAFLIGGHTIDDTELKFGYSITGKVSTESLMTNRNAKASQSIFITKPILTLHVGVINNPHFTKGFINYNGNANGKI